MRTMRCVLGVWLVLAVGAVFAEEGSSTRRFGIFIGSNDGGRERAGLRWAESDARALSGVFGELGGIRREDNVVLTRPDIREIRQRLRRVSEEEARPQARTELVFYFSGHSNEEGLLLGRESYSYKALREDINAVPADMRIVILDSCASGAFTRMKGGVKTRVFLLDEQAGATGYAFLTSSSATEVSQESDRIRGSYFTHSLIAGLRGAADTMGNGRVTLNEAYRYAYDETLAKTEWTLFGRQHPSYDIQISGSGDVVLTDVRSTSAGLVLDETVAGRLSIRDHDGFLVAEITKAQGKTLELALEPGRYRLTLRVEAGSAGETGLSGAEVTLEEDKRLTVKADDFSPLDLAEAVARGDVEAEEDAVEFATDEGAAIGDGEVATEGTGEAGEAAGTGEAAEPADIQEPVKFQVFPGLEDGRRDTTVNLLIGLFIAESYRLEGLGFALIGLSTWGDMTGLQVSGLVNFQGASSEGSPFPGFLHPTGAGMRGAQVAGIGNWAGSVQEGAQFAPVYNWVADSIEGAQFAGIVNWVGDSIEGAQFGGLANWTGGTMRGAQFAGIVNYAGGGMTGNQAASIANVAWGTTRGFQAGLFNIRDKGSGGQLGLVNIAFDERVNAVGLVNVVKNGLFHPLVFTDNLARFNIGLKSGNKWLYSLVRLGADGAAFDPGSGFVIVGNSLTVNTLGIGVELTRKKLFLDMDISAGHIPIGPEAGGFGLSSFLLQARLGAGFKLFSHLGFSGGLTYTWFFRGEHEIGFYAGGQF